MLPHNKLSSLGLKIFIVLSIVVFIGYGTASAYSSSDMQSIIDLTPFYDPGAQCDENSSSTTVSASIPGATSGTWTASVQAPYYMEEYAINVLEDVAQKLGVDPSSAVTQQHVMALIAWFYSEGGDIEDGPPSKNPDPQLFNLLNTSIQDPSIETTDGPGGLESFNSFDDGVEGTARTMVGSLQSRIGSIVTQSTSTAQQVISAIANFQDYPGNAAWADGTDGSTTQDIINFNQTDYLPSLTTVLQQVEANYNEMATLEIGTPEAEDLLNEHVASSELMYPSVGTSVLASTASSSDISTSSCAGTGSGVVNGSIVQTALGLAWPTPPDVAPTRNPLTPTPAYATAVRQYDPGADFSGADCGVFVGIVMHSSGADPNYPSSGTSEQQSYVESHPNLYTIINNAQSTADLQPGDIAIINEGSGEGADGHTYIYVGPQAGGYNEASASEGDRMPSLGNAILQDDRGHYVIARFIGSTSS
jgi:hypothetical protein